MPFPGFSGGKSFTASQMEGKSNEEVEMMKLMGFTNFDTTKNKKVCLLPLINPALRLVQSKHERNFIFGFAKLILPNFLAASSFAK